MERKFIFNKRGVSGVVTTVILVALVLVASSVVWAVVNGMIQGKLSETESCFGILGKISINSKYTCYTTTLKEFQFSINIEDINPDAVLVAIDGDAMSKSFKITDQNSVIDNLKPYGGNYGDNVILPQENAGLTYVANLDAIGMTKPDSIKLVPVINGKQCEVIDSLNVIEKC